jgi:hypothetical protein
VVQELRGGASRGGVSVRGSLSSMRGGASVRSSRSSLMGGGISKRRGLFEGRGLHKGRDPRKGRSLVLRDPRGARWV